MSKQYTLEDLEPFLKGEQPLPNFQEEDIARVVNNIASGGHSMLPRWGWAKANDPANNRDWAQYFLMPTPMGNAQCGSFDGRAYVFIWRTPNPIVGSFAICRHEKQEGHGANHSRGWHPGHCRKCGMDMTVDSGD